MRSLLALIITLTGLSTFAQDQLTLSTDVYNETPFSDQYSEDGALIRDVPFGPVSDLRGQIEELYELQLEHRNEAHITVITPPEAQGWSTEGIGINSLINKDEYLFKYETTLQSTSFEVVCVGSRKNSTNTVFYLVVRTPDLFDVRREIQREMANRSEFANTPIYFNSEEYWPHITIGYVGGDVFGMTKGEETCLEGVELVLE